MNFILMKMLNGQIQIPTKIGVSNDACLAFRHTAPNSCLIVIFCCGQGSMEGSGTDSKKSMEPKQVGAEYSQLAVRKFKLVSN